MRAACLFVGVLCVVAGLVTQPYRCLADTTTSTTAPDASTMQCVCTCAPLSSSTITSSSTAVGGWSGSSSGPPVNLNLTTPSPAPPLVENGDGVVTSRTAASGNPNDTLIPVLVVVLGACFLCILVYVLRARCRAQRTLSESREAEETDAADQVEVVPHKPLARPAMPQRPRAN
jgi:hypothetical protein